MISMVPVHADGGTAVGITVQLPKTQLVILAGTRGYLMCGALDIGLLDERLRARGVVAGRAVGVRTLEELLDAPLERVTTAARALGLREGMCGREALAILVTEAPGAPERGAGMQTAGEPVAAAAPSGTAS